MPKTLSAGTIVSAVVALLTAGPVAAQTALESVVDSIAHEHLAEGHLAGLTVGVTQGPDTLLLKAYGHADLEWDVPMPIDAIHEIGSVTKQFTAAAVLQLWSQGAIDLDADLTTYLPDYDTHGQSIPVRRLLDHTSGIKSYTELPRFGEIAPRALPRDSLVAMFESEPLDVEPGSALIYSNSAYFLLGLVIEAVTEQSYEDYLAEHVFPRARMHHSSYCSNHRVLPRRAHGYGIRNDTLVRADYIDHTWPYAAGSICATAGDLIAWNRALHGGQVLPDSAYALMVTPVPLNDGTPVRYAMGLAVFDGSTGRIIDHGGGIPGFLTHSRYYPDEDVTVVVLQNTTGPPGPAAVAEAIGTHLFGDDHLPAPMPYPTDMTPFEGRYRGPARGRRMTVTVQAVGDSLTLQTGGSTPRTVTYRGGTTFGRRTTRYLFEGDDEGMHTLRVDHVGGHYVLARVDEAAEAAARVEVPGTVLETYVGRYALTPAFHIEVTLEEAQLHVQATGQPRFPVYADSETRFHLEVVEAAIEFVVAGDGTVEALVLHQGGRSQRADRVPE